MLTTTDLARVICCEGAVGTRWAYRASYVPAEVATIHCVVTIERGKYGRFLLTDEGWVRDE